MAEALVIKGLSKRFGGLRAVQDVSFSVQENETVALIGPNGAGKTTSFHLITGFHRPDAGSVLAFGKEIVGLRPHDVCALGLARTFQVVSNVFASRRKRRCSAGTSKGSKPARKKTCRLKTIDPPVPPLVCNNRAGASTRPVWWI